MRMMSETFVRQCVFAGCCLGSTHSCIHTYVYVFIDVCIYVHCNEAVRTYTYLHMYMYVYVHIHAPCFDHPCLQVL